MAKTGEAKKRIKQLREIIDYHRKQYHELDAPELSDEAYDSLVKELTDLETKFPDLQSPDSPSVRIGGEPLASFQKITLAVPQWSFDNVFNFQELSDWKDRALRFLDREKGITGPEISFCTELKIDGLKVVLTYKEGKLISGATRGNGVMGEDVTQNIQTIKSIPLTLTAPVDCIVVGEVWLPEKELERINNERKKLGEALYANARNVAAGTLRQLDPKIVSSRNLESFIYDIDLFDGKNTKFTIPSTQSEELSLLKELGFQVNKNYSICKTIDEIEKYYANWVQKKHDLPYGVDGVVIKINERNIQEQLGYTAKAPRFGIAYKFPAVQTTTVVEDIVLQVGRTGVITPVAKLRPVLIDGSTVSRATLHNEDEIKRLDVRVGDTVILQKAGDVIPDIVQVLTDLRTGKEKPYRFPSHVPECGGDGSIERIPGQAAYRCVFKNSGAQQKRKLEYFVSKKAFNIDGLGKKIIEQLMDEGIVSSFSDIFTLTKGDVDHLEGFGELSANNLLTSIEKAKKVTFPRFLTSLSIPQVGEETAEDLADSFLTLANLENAKFEDLESISGVGPIIARSVVDWFAEPDNKKLIDALEKHVIILSHKKQSEGGVLSGKTFVLTGTLPTLSRDEAKKLIKQAGGDVAGSVSSKTDFLLAGGDAGEKLTKAQNLGVRIVDEKQFLSMLGK